MKMKNFRLKQAESKNAAKIIKIIIIIILTRYQLIFKLIHQRIMIHLHQEQKIILNM